VQEIIGVVSNRPQRLKGRLLQLKLEVLESVIIKENFMIIIHIDENIEA